MRDDSFPLRGWETTTGHTRDETLGCDSPLTKKIKKLNQNFNHWTYNRDETPGCDSLVRTEYQSLYYFLQIIEVGEILRNFSWSFYFCDVFVKQKITKL